MPDGIGILRQELTRDAVGLVFALALFVLHYAALEVEFFLVQNAEKMAHAIALGKERVIEHGGRHIFKIVGAVAVCGAVHVRGTDALQRVDVGRD